MVSALLFGAGASSGLVLGGVVGSYWDAPENLVATCLAFASGALITALAFDLFERSYEISGPVVAGAGLLAGSIVFTVIDYLLDERGGDDTGVALLAGVTLDGVPENAALGVVLIGGTGGALAILAAIFASNFPEALGGAQSMRESGRAKGSTIGIWAATAVLLTLSVVAGNTLFAGLSENMLSLVRSFAGGAVLASIASEVMPDAYAEGGPLVAIATTAGFLLTFLLK